MRYKNFIASEDWKKIRESVLEERGLECERCHKQCKKSQLHIHHKDYNKEFSYEDFDNLMVLCKECHNIMHQDLVFFESRMHPIKNGDKVIGYIDKARYENHVERNKRGSHNDTDEDKRQGNRTIRKKDDLGGEVIGPEDYERYCIR